MTTPAAVRATNLRTMPFAADRIDPMPNPRRPDAERRVVVFCSRTGMMTDVGAGAATAGDFRTPRRTPAFGDATGSGKCQENSPSCSTRTTAPSSGPTSTSTSTDLSPVDSASERRPVPLVGAIVNSCVASSS